MAAVFGERPAFEAVDDSLVQEVLDEYGSLVRRQVKRWLPTNAPRSYLDELLADYPRRGGKMLRPCICLATARLFGADLEDAVASAVSIELLHNALLIHDDIEDESDQRRGSPTLHALHGVPLALNAGDALGLLSLAPLKANFERLGMSLALQIFEETERTAWASAEGQALELGWQRESRLDVSEEDYLTMVLLKTCWLAFIHPLRVGCLIGSRGRYDVDRLVRLGNFIGSAFQIQDDLLNLDSGASYGKEADGDLREGKRTLMIIHALEHAPRADRLRLERFLRLAREARSVDEIQWAHDLIVRCGSMAHARGVAAGMAGAALCEFERCFPDQAPSRDLSFLRAMPTWVLQRVH
ncbi:polyprenyl synthetase family protein [Variovorax sp. GT1P44]|uniref:polyprenyl synthetase family protein n=1 Tax=Variovorax sp. GT1P44 TaxID=3443742 RepID=UPI003F48B418